MSNKQRKSPKSKKKGILYVVLHGLIGLVDVGADGFVAHVLDMGDDHKYIFGNWLAERDIPARNEGQDPTRARLLGVKKGEAELSCKLNPVFNVATMPPESHSSVRAVIHLPRPSRIHYPLKGKLLGKSPLTGTLGKLADKPTHICAIRVFEYHFSNYKDVCLVAEDGWSWQCPYLATSKSFYWAVLHVYNEPDRDLGGEDLHNRKEFNMSARLFGSDLLLKGETKLDEVESIRGLHKGELVFLSQRSLHVLGIVNKARGSSSKATDVGSGGGQVCGGLNAFIVPSL